MIQKISYLDNYTKSNYNKTSFNKQKNVSETIHNKPCYIPVFKGIYERNNVSSLQSTKNVPSICYFNSQKPYKKINLINSKERLIGDFYDEFSDNVAILLGSNKNILLTKNKEMSPEIFAHNFSKKVENNSYNGLNFSSSNTDVVYINTCNYKNLLNENNEKYDGTNRNLFSPQENLLDTLIYLSREREKAGKVSDKKIVIIDNFERFAETFGNRNINDALKILVPNLYIVGIANESAIKTKSIEKNQGDKIKPKYQDFRRMSIKGLSTEDAKIFFQKNPQIVNNVLKTQKKENLSISKEALNELVERSSNKVNADLPNSALTTLKMVAAMKMQKTPNSKLKDVTITKTDVNKFFENHSILFDDIKPETGYFSLVEKSKIMLKDLGGMSVEKQIVQEDILPYLKNPQKFLAEGGVAPGGILLKGPPGNGKTFLAKALAGESNTPFISASGSDFVEMYVGVGAKRIRDLYALARNAAENSANKSAIVFIDEIDAIGKKRGNSLNSNSETEKTLNQILVEMDGFNSKESPVKIITIVATNRPDILDDALTRPGRFDYSLEVKKPKTNQDRYEVLQIHSKKLPFKNEEEKTNILKNAAKSTKGCSNAEIAGIMKKVQMLVTKRDTNKFVTQDDIIEGLLTVNYGTINKVGSEKTIDEKLEVLVHEYGHGVGVDFLSPILGETIDLITLDERGDFLGMVKRNMTSRNPNFKSVILSSVISHLGGMYEPNYETQGRSAGVSQDIDNASTLIQKAITEWGEGIFTPPVTLVSRDENETIATKEYRDTVRKANEKNIAKDTLLFATLSTTIAAMIKKLHKGSEKQYIDLYLENVGKGGNNLSGEAFSKMRNSWIAKNGKEKQAKKMLAEINTMLEDVRNMKSRTFKRLMKQVKKSL